MLFTSHAFSRVVSLLILQVACRSGASPEAVECLLAYHPDGTQEGDSLKRIPLHCKCPMYRGGCLRYNFSYLYRFSPYSTYLIFILPDALKNDAGAEVVRLLMDANPEGVNRQDHRGWSPLHVACSMGTDLAIIETLLEDYPETVLMKTHKGSDCIKCAKMSKGHPNEAAICQYIERKMAEVEGRKAGGDSEESEDDDEGEQGSQNNDSDDESHHQDDDEVDLLDLGGNENTASAASGKGEGGEGDLLGLTSNSDANNGEKAKDDDLLLDMDPADPQDKATAQAVKENENERDAEALPPMPTSAPPPPPPPADPQSTINGNNDMNSAPPAFMPAETSEESPTSTVDANFLNIPPEDQNPKDDQPQPIADLADGDMLGDIVLEEGSADILKALEGNLIDL